MQPDEAVVQVDFAKKIIPVSIKMKFKQRIGVSNRQGFH